MDGQYGSNNNKFCIFLSSSKKWAHFKRYVEAFKNLKSNANIPFLKPTKKKCKAWSIYMNFFPDVLYILVMSHIFRTWGGCLASYFLVPWFFPWIFPKFLACASLKNYGKKRGKFPGIPKIWCQKLGYYMKKINGKEG